jgi:hypothetical protein
VTTPPNVLFVLFAFIFFALPAYGQVKTYTCGERASQFPDLDKIKVISDRPFILEKDGKLLKFKI